MSASVMGISVVGGLVDEQPSGDGIVYRTYHYELAFDGLPGPGRVLGRVEFFDGDSRPIVTETIPILGYVPAPVTSVPPILFASSDPTADPLRLQFELVRTDSGGNFHAELIAGGDDVLVEPVESDDTGMAFSIRASANSGEQKGRLVFRTDVEGAERVEVPYLFRIGNASDSPGTSD